jgi:AraC family transcriptional regulator, transcriptional activator of pobA
MVMLQLRILLIKASRLKLKQQPQVDYESWRQELPPVLRRLSQLVEEHYRRKHRPQDYAKLLNITPNALNKLVKKHLHQTLTQYIRDRILEHAKWQLLHTQRPIKSIAHELGFEDELYFSRTFKRAIGQSPRTFRNKGIRFVMDTARSEREISLPFDGRNGMSVRNPVADADLPPDHYHVAVN